MIDTHFRAPYQKLIIEPLLKTKRLKNTLPNLLTLFALVFGVFCFIFLFFQQKTLSFISLICSGFLDTLDGSLARYLDKSTPFGAVFDIFSDRVVETCIILGLYFFSPDVRALPTLLMLASSYLCVTSFLVVGIFTENSSKKGFHYSPGLIERAEAFIFFSVMICLPITFTPLAYLYSLLVALTATLRLYEFKRFTKQLF